MAQLMLEKRTITGKKTKQLKKTGLIPAVVFANDEDSVNVQLPEKDFERAYKQSGHSALVDIALDGSSFKVLINEVQINPKSRHVNHVMLHKVNLKEEITASIPVELIGEAPAIKVEKGILVTPVAEIEIRCLPTDLPAKIEVSIDSLVNIGDSLTVANITLPKGVELVREEDLELVVATTTHAQLVEEETTEATTPTEGIEVELSVKKGKSDEDASAE